jgi:hypothetical protein
VLEQRFGGARIDAVHIVAKVPSAVAAPLAKRVAERIRQDGRGSGSSSQGRAPVPSARRRRTLASMRCLHFSYACMALVHETSHFSSSACFGSGASSSSLGSKMPPYLMGRKLEARK